MPKTRDVKGEFILFQFKLYGEEKERWEAVRFKAIMRGVPRKVRPDDSAIRRALLGMRDAEGWLVTEEERDYFRGLCELPDSLKDVIIQMDGAVGPERRGEYADAADIRPASPETISEHERQKAAAKRRQKAKRTAKKR